MRRHVGAVATAATFVYPAAMLLFRPTSLVAAVSLAPLAIASAALSQERPPDPNFTPNTSPVVGYLVMAVLFGIIVTVSLMPSKRSHTDL